jgi:hypothetical protein
MVRMQRVVCPACGHGHTFSLPVGEPIAPAYGYMCPETGRAATIGAQGQWQAFEHPSPGGGGPLNARGRGGSPNRCRAGGPAVGP